MKRLPETEQFQQHVDAFFSSDKDAVETAIDIAKSDRSSTWEDVANQRPIRIPKWEERLGAPSRARETGKRSRARR